MLVSLIAKRHEVLDAFNKHHLTKNKRFKPENMPEEKYLFEEDQLLHLTKVIYLHN